MSYVYDSKLLVQNLCHCSAEHGPNFTTLKDHMSKADEGFNEVLNDEWEVVDISYVQVGTNLLRMISLIRRHEV